MARNAQREILAALRKAPGQGIRQLQRSTGLALGTVQKHVKLLQDSGRIKSTPRGRQHLWHLPGAKLPQPVPNDLEVRIFDFVKKHPHARQFEILAAFSEVPRSTMQWHLKRMSD